jgi:DNA invertase Pin-like site-specific DNA recombinase
MRLLQVARLSRVHDDSSSLDKQDAQCQRWAEAYGHQIIGTAADSGVSGKTDPFARPELGPWLSSPVLIDSYDGIVAAKLDRFARSVRYWAHLLDWARDHGKTVVCVDPFIDFSEPTGQLVGMIMSWLAEQELAQITQRSKDTREYLQANGYLTGKPPFGYRIVKDRDHKVLEPDPAEAQLVGEGAAMYLGGSSLRAVAEWLDQRCRAPQGELWSAASLSALFRNPILAGRRTDASGRTILKVPPILDRAIWERLQALQAAKARTTGAEPKALLTGIAVCGKCGGPMYRLITKPKGRRYDYYRCHGTERNPSTCRNMIRLEQLDAKVERYMTTTLARWPRYETITIPGHGYKDEIAEVEQDLRELDYDAPDFLERQAALLAERARLRNLPSVPARTERRPTGDTVGEHWGTLTTDAERRAFLLALGMTVRVWRGKEVNDRVDDEDLVADIVAFEVFGTGADYQQFLSGDLLNQDDDDV